MKPTLLLIHGWGFGPAVWGSFRAQLPEFAVEAADLGYFGPPRFPEVEGPVLVVGHSLGALLALRSPPADCVGLVAINGFDHFVTVEGAEGVAPRVLDRMIARFPADPAGTVADFRKRCGDTAPFGDPDPLHLGLGLELLRDADERARSRQWTGPLLSLQGGDDPILPKALREKAFAEAPGLIVEHIEKAGHLLPVTHAAYCADRIRAMAQGL